MGTYRTCLGMSKILLLLLPTPTPSSAPPNSVSLCCISSTSASPSLRSPSVSSSPFLAVVHGVLVLQTIGWMDATCGRSGPKTGPTPAGPRRTSGGGFGEGAPEPGEARARARRSLKGGRVGSTRPQGTRKSAASEGRTETIAPIGSGMGQLRKRRKRRRMKEEDWGRGNMREEEEEEEEE